MNEQDRVARVMRALGGAEMPTGLEARVLARVAVARRERRGFGFGGVWGMAVAAGLVVAVGVGVHGRGRSDAPAKISRSGSVAIAARTRGDGTEVASDTFPQRLTPHTHGGAYGATEVTPLPGQRPSQRALTAKQVESFPAPPEPLTEQEKLLVKVARNGDRGNDFELLDPETVDVAFAGQDVEMAERMQQGRLAPMHGEYWKRTQHN